MNKLKGLFIGGNYWRVQGTVGVSSKKIVSKLGRVCHHFCSKCEGVTQCESILE